MKGKHVWTLTVASASIFALAGCGTHLASLPLAPVTGHAAHGGAASQGVALYFGDQPHPRVRREIAEVASNARVMRAPSDDAMLMCNQAMAMALHKLRSEARSLGANALVNVSTSFHRRARQPAGAKASYTCAMSRNAVAMRVQGRAVVIDSK